MKNNNTDISKIIGNHKLSELEQARNSSLCDILHREVVHHECNEIKEVNKALNSYLERQIFFKTKSSRALFLLGYVTKSIMDTMTPEEKVDFSKDKLVSLNSKKFSREHIYRILLPAVTYYISEKALKNYDEYMQLISQYIVETDLDEINISETPYTMYFFTGYNFSIFQINDILTFSEASNMWGLNSSTLRKLVNTGKLELNKDYRKSGNVWLITKGAMERIYGKIKDLR